jgi:S-(hydroxymethyl)glutathione dehydrogenase/alcohol dehydrogenase
VFVVEPVAWKREQALKFGATHVYPDIESATAGAAEITAGGMAKKVIVTVGEADGHDVDTWMGITAKAGTCVVTAMSKSLLDTEVTLNLSMLTLMQKNLQGTIFGGANPQYDIPMLLSLYQAGKLNIDDMITRQYALEEINDGYADMVSGKNIRGVIRFSDTDR